jgi:NifU-like protein involved in Fe-S cluster formation
MLEDGVIVDFAQEVKACALGQATAAIVGQHVVGLDAGEFKAVKKQFTAMVAGENIDFPDKWHELSILSPVKDHPGRKGSVMLPFECLTDIFSL